MTHRTGFTLIELLVVIAIISVLASLVIPALFFGSQVRDDAQTASTIMKLAAAIEIYQCQFGDYPPTALSLIGYSTTVTSNEGIESVVACLATKKKGGPFEQSEPGAYGNTDKDKVRSDWKNNWRFGNYNGREILDAWGNPLVYVRASDYSVFNNRKNLRRIRLADGKFNGKIVIVKLPPVNKMTGTRPGDGHFIIWSLGQNGKDEQGGGDDVASWK